MSTEPPDDDDDPLRERLRKIVPRHQVSAAAMYIRRLQTRAGLFHETPQIGRYRLGATLGQGGMGIVVRAHHLDFGVDVALKVLDGQVATDDLEDSQRAAWQAHVHDEARKLKQIRGEHVVGVYDVGIEDDLRWLAMAYIDGVDLESWLTKAPRPIDWRTIVAYFRDAAEGLASVHAAGLVHRDFKPRNAVLERERNRVCVIDLGLATSPGGDDQVSSAGARANVHPLREAAETQRSAGEQPRRTMQVIAGTEDYMSPEQYRGDRIDHTSDQFSWCVALYWALYGRFPFADDEPTALHVARLRGRTSLPRHKPGRADEVPRWLHRLLERGLSRRPADRFPSMHAVIAELTRDRRRPLRIGALLGAAVLATAALSFVMQPPAQAPTCRARTEGSRATFEARRLELASQLQPAALAALDSFDQRWKDRWDAACDGSFLRGEPGLEARQFCLDRQRQTFDRLSDALLAGPTTPTQALKGIHELPDPATCDAAGLNRAKPIEPAQQGTVALAAEQSSTARVAMWLGDYEKARELADLAVRTARASDHSPTLAAALQLSGELARRSGKVTDGRAALEQAHAAAIAGRDVFTAIAATHEHARTALLGQEDREAAAASLRLAAAHFKDIDWYGAPACTLATTPSCAARTRLWAEHEDLHGLLAIAGLDLAAALDHQNRAITTLQPIEHEARPELARARFNRGRTHLLLGQHALADADFDASTKLTIELFGPEHPDLAADFFTLAELARQRGDYDTAIRTAERSRVLYLRAEGERSAHIASTESLLGAIHLYRRDFARARQHTAIASDLFKRLPDASPYEPVRVDQLVAAITMEEGNKAAAAGLYVAVAGRFADLGDPDSRCDEALARIDAGKCLIPDDTATAREHLVAAEAALTAAGGPKVCPAGYELARTRGDLAFSEKDHATAIAAYEVAANDPTIPDAVLADVNWALAQNYVLSGGDGVKARRLAGAARDSFAAQGPGGKNKVAVIDSWLALHL